MLNRLSYVFLTGLVAVTTGLIITTSVVPARGKWLDRHALIRGRAASEAYDSYQNLTSYIGRIGYFLTFAGIVGLVVAPLLRSRVRRTGTGSAATPDDHNLGHRCHACQAILMPDMLFCPGCGAAVDAESVGRTTTDGEACSSCGAALIPEMRFCAKCGAIVGRATDDGPWSGPESVDTC
jgi:RNA polymerase subunit RPABC4/transcription elongation factor Spt4